MEGKSLFYSRKFLLTFDVEDFINSNAISALHFTLKILSEYKLKAIFFITECMAERISNFPEIINLLKKHEIGYHSTSHSVRPVIPEYTDVKSYKKAYVISLERETSHINPLTGKIEGEGGIYLLQDLFHPKKIEAFRAPGMCWTPPHLEALNRLGIKYDFSSNLTFSETVFWKGITFYPYTFIQQWYGRLHDYECLLTSILKNKITVFDLHPTLLVNQSMWDEIYFKGNPKSLPKAQPRYSKEVERLFKEFEKLIKRINVLRKMKLIDTEPKLEPSNKKLSIDTKKIEKCYEASMSWSKTLFNYNPKYIKNHFYEFFDENR